MATMSPVAVVRGFFAAATVLFAAISLVFRDDPRWFAASGLCGLLWGGWSFLAEHVLVPLAEWSSQLIARVAGGHPRNNDERRQTTTGDEGRQ
jgi:hypothetical protein